MPTDQDPPRAVTGVDMSNGEDRTVTSAIRRNPDGPAGPRPLGVEDLPLLPTREKDEPRARTTMRNILHVDKMQAMADRLKMSRMPRLPLDSTGIPSVDQINRAGGVAARRGGDGPMSTSDEHEGTDDLDQRLLRHALASEITPIPETDFPIDVRHRLAPLTKIGMLKSVDGGYAVTFLGAFHLEALDSAERVWAEMQASARKKVLL